MFDATRDNLLADAIGWYFHEVGDVGVLRLDRQRCVVACNAAFRDMVGRDEVPEGTPLGDLLALAGWLDDELPPDRGGHRLGRMQVPTPDAPSGAVLVRAWAGDDGWVLFAEPAALTDEEVVGRLSAMNADLTDLTRELNKKQAALEEANQRIARLARTDPMTGLANRRELMERLGEAVSAAARHAQPLALVMADVDHFKSVNDTFGHETGDEVLKALARVLDEVSRAEDVAARFGGEEFVILAPNTDKDQARALAKRARQAFETCMCLGDERRITASFGVAEWREGESAEELIARADAAMYAAKKAGRNRVVEAADLVETRC